MIRPVAAALLGAAAAVALPGPAPSAAAGLASFRSQAWGLTVRYPPGLVAGTAFKSNYMDRGAWRVSYAADSGPGTPIVAFSLPDIDVVDAGGAGKATAELRIGASRDPDSVANCLTYGMNSGNNVESRMRRIGGVDFTEVPDNSEGEMSKMIRTDDFRAVHAGACFAIDLVLYVEGTSNKRPEHAPAQVDRLRAILAAIRFD